MKTILIARSLTAWLFYFLIILAGYTCSSADETTHYEWNSEELNQTIWDGEIQLNNQKEKITISFDSNSEGYCYLQREDIPSCLFEYSINKNKIIFYNIYGDKENLIINGSWDFSSSKKKNVTLERIISQDVKDYIILKKREL